MAVGAEILAFINIDKNPIRFLYVIDNFIGNIRS